MEININQQKLSIGDKYQIFINGSQTHNAAAKLFRLFAEINLYNWDMDQPVMVIKKRFAFFVASYDISTFDGAVIELRTISFWKAHYQCQLGADFYDIYRHRGRKCSIYKNDKQVAWWDKEAVSWFNGDNYRIVADNNCNINLIIALCLAMDNYVNNDKEKGSFNIDIGRLGPQAKPFDATWQPKY